MPLSATDARTIYIDSFKATDDHDSLRRTFSKFGKVNLVSLPRFPQSKKFKGFGFVEFTEQSAADKVAAMPSDADELCGIRVMSKIRWLEMKEQLKLRLASSDAPEASVKANNANEPGDSKSVDTAGKVAAKKKKKLKRRKPAAGGHIHFGDSDPDEKSDSSDGNDQQEAAKKQKV
ncbi:unnamed protein product [Phytophthora lilii]|uniref:Unnamed protein product n=1 Tax=Phytophthora lilii TaxID=2077276 RepID=A0A9W6X1L1_9STRA|nr:unnamed protein product [Phytophthora lilii]